MSRWFRRVRRGGLLMAASGLFVFNGCGLSDYQLAQIWQSVLTSALNTIVSNALTAAAGNTAA